MSVQRVIGLGFGAAAMVLLAGCGGAAQPSTGAPASSQPPAASAPSTQASSSTAPSTQAPSSTAPSSQTSEPTGGDSGSKPTKSEIVAGLAKFYETSQGLPAAKAKKFASCMVDQMYDKAKTSTLEAMRDGTPTKMDTSDTGLLAESAMKCQSALN